MQMPVSHYKINTIRTAAETARDDLSDIMTDFTDLFLSRIYFYAYESQSLKLTVSIHTTGK